MSPGGPPVGRVVPRGDDTSLPATLPTGLPTTPLGGLTEDEAAERRAQGLGNTAPPATTRTYVQSSARTSSPSSTTSSSCWALALVVVGRPFDAFVSLAVISTNIVVGISRRSAPSGRSTASPC